MDNAIRNQIDAVRKLRRKVELEIGNRPRIADLNRHSLRRCYGNGRRQLPGLCAGFRSQRFDLASDHGSDR